jgi:hypothetical protein
MARNYDQEYERYQGTAAQKKRRAARNAARAAMLKSGKVKKGDGNDVDHEDGNPMNNKRSNWAVVSKSKNRSYPRTKTARKKNKTD